MNFVWFVREVCLNPLRPLPNSLRVTLISCSFCPVMTVGADLECFTQPNGRHGPSFLSSTTQTCMFSPSRPPYITSTNLSNNLTRDDAQTPGTRQLLEPPLSIPFRPSSLCLLLPSFLLFSLLNCKYQVPFILFCYFLLLLLLYCCSCNFFSLVDRRSSGRAVYPQSQSVNTISFQSLVQEGKNRTKCFIFILSPSISLFTTFPFLP